ncbi:MAG: tyrosine-type recombinase/integrase [Oligoflexales bacterium]|nr:tyrosine-type recombinase/integrase [Oligoflexales bacterium]
MSYLVWKEKKAYAVTRTKDNKRQWIPLKNLNTGRNYFSTKYEGKLAFLEWLKWNDPKITRKEVLFKDIMESYLENAKTQKAASTYKGEKSNSQALKFFYDLPISKIGLGEVEEFKKMGTGWKTTTWALRLGLLKSIIIYAKAHNFIINDSIQQLKIPRPKIYEMAPRFVDLSVIDLVISKLSGHHKSYAMILKHLMLRPSEVIRLKKENIDFKNRVVQVYGKNKHWEFLPFNDELEPYLKDIPLNVTQNAFASVLKRICNKNEWKDNYPRVTPYVFRHSSASALVNSNIVGGTRVVQALLRHKDPKLTARYAHPYEDTMREALKKLVT